MNKKILFILLITITFCYPLLTQENGPAETEEEAPPREVVNEEDLLFDEPAVEEQVNTESLSTFSIWDFVRMILIFALVIAAIYLVFFLLKKAGPKRISDNQLISVLSTQPLQGSKALHVVEVGKQYFFIGASDNNISLLSEITDKETIDDFRIKISSGVIQKTGGRSFKDALSSVFRRETGSSRPGNPMDDSAVFLKKQRDRLKNI